VVAADREVHSSMSSWLPRKKTDVNASLRRRNKAHELADAGTAVDVVPRKTTVSSNPAIV
jgi:hypothetical protein